MPKNEVGCLQMPSLLGMINPEIWSGRPVSRPLSESGGGTAPWRGNASGPLFFGVLPTAKITPPVPADHSTTSGGLCLTDSPILVGTALASRLACACVCLRCFVGNTGLHYASETKPHAYRIGFNGCRTTARPHLYAPRVARCSAQASSGTSTHPPASTRPGRTRARADPAPCRLGNCVRRSARG